MTLQELAEVCARQVSREPEARVVVRTSQGGCPTNRMVDVNAAALGFDWTARMFLVHLDEPVVVYRRQAGTAREMAQERLALLKANHAKLGFTYIAKARERAWEDGFIEGWKTFVAAVSEADVETGP